MATNEKCFAADVNIRTIPVYAGNLQTFLRCREYKAELYSIYSIFSDKCDA